MDNSVATLEVGMIVNVYPACQTGTVLDIIMHPVTNVLTCAVRLNDGGLASFDTHDLTPVLTPSPLDSLPEPYWVGLMAAAETCVDLDMTPDLVMKFCRRLGQNLLNMAEFAADNPNENFPIACIYRCMKNCEHNSFDVGLAHFIEKLHEMHQATQPEMGTLIKSIAELLGAIHDPTN